ncbi:MAG: GrpB family protein [Bacillota bacterium]
MSAQPVVIVEYDPTWPVDFEALKGAYEAALHGLIESVEHVGSTAVPGLAAKPIIDVDLVIADRALLPEVIQRLAALGYRHEGDLGVAGREAFARDGDPHTPRDGSGRVWPAHHLYVCASDCAALHEHLRFRDYLRAHPEKAREYGELKQHLAAAFREDRAAYGEAKTAFVRSILQLCST